MLQEIQSECWREEFRVEDGEPGRTEVCKDDKNTEALTQLLELTAKKVFSPKLTRSGLHTHTLEHTHLLCFLPLHAQTQKIIHSTPQEMLKNIRICDFVFLNLITVKTRQ